MDPIVTALVVILLMFLFLATGAWIFVGLLLTSLVSMFFLTDFSVFRIGSIIMPMMVKTVTSWELAAVPLFIWMGEIINRSDVSERLFRGLTPWVNGLPGGLVHTNVAGCVLFAAVSGSSVATTATIGKITTRALAERKYDVNLSVGSVAAAGSIGIMIPPSITMIIYGMIAEVSVAKLFAAGMFPGLLLGVLYSGFIAARCMLRPALAPTPETRPTMKQRLLALGDLLPVLFLILLVLGGIYTGLATPSEAAALGVVGALCITVSTGQLTWAVFVESAMSAVKVTAMLGTAFAAAALLSTTMGFLHVPQTIATFIAGLDLTPAMLLVVLGAFYILLGCVLESISLILMTMPISYPLVVQAGFDPVWFGVFLVLVIEMGLITPPIGFNLFVLRGITGHPIGRIAWGAFPFFLLMIVVAVILAVFPGLALWLPNALFG